MNKWVKGDDVQLDGVRYRIESSIVLGRFEAWKEGVRLGRYYKLRKVEGDHVLIAHESEMPLP